MSRHHNQISSGFKGHPVRKIELLERHESKRLLKIAQQSHVLLGSALETQVSEDAEHEYNKITVAEQTSTAVLGEARACVGQVVKHEGNAQMGLSTPAKEAPDPTSTNRITPLPDVVNRPATVSPYL